MDFITNDPTTYQSRRGFPRTQSRQHSRLSVKNDPARHTLPIRRKSSNAPESPFLKLPVELRLKIYGYLIPNQCPYQWPRNEHTAVWERVRPPRRDKEIGSVSLLRTNHQIYEEVTSEIYGSILVTARLRGAGVHVLGRAVPKTLPKPLAFSQISHLGFEIHMMNPGDEMLPAQRRVLAGMFSHTSPAFPRLKKLEVWIPFPSHFYYHLNGKPEEMRILVEANLNPFREARGLEDVKFTVGFFESPEIYPSIPLWRNQMEGIVKEFAAGLIDEMTGKGQLTSGATTLDL